MVKTNNKVSIVVKIRQNIRNMKKYIIIKICSKYDIATNIVAFSIMHCILFAANQLNNAPNSSRQVGGEVVFFPGASTSDV